MDVTMIKIILRQSSGDQFEVEIAGNASVKELKEECAKKQTNISAEETRLIFKGKILKDELTLDEYKIVDGLTVHLVKGAKAGGAGAPGNQPEQSSLNPQPSGNVEPAAQANPFGAMGGMPPGMGGMGGMPPGFGGMGGMGGMPGGMGGGQMPSPDQMQQMMSNPMVQQMMSDPSVMQNIIQSNPMLKQMADGNPQLRAMLDNPEMMQQMMNPQAMQQAMQMMQGGGGMGGMPGAGGAGGMPGGMGGMQMPPGFNPAMFGGMPGAGGAGGAGAQAADTRPPREKYVEELKQIKEMGFNDEDAILQILEQTGGNVQLALEKLFQ